ncbi:MAG: hypothetical protein DPW09_32175 [Anaerolineae bacterium]|nr:hypothetical protein [Anaerolineae bacterium]
MTAKVTALLSPWLDKELTVWRLLAVTLLLAALNSVALGLASVVRGLELGLLLPIAILGTLTGWTLAATSWPGWWAGAIAGSAGVVLMTVRVGRLDGSILALLGQLVGLAWQALRWPGNGPPDTTPLQSTLAGLWLGVVTLWSRLLEWVANMAGGEPVFDPAATALAWGVALWLVAAWSGWAVRRRDQSLLAILPAGALLVISMAYGGGNFAFLLLLLGLTWLLAALVEHTVRERRWQVEGIDFALEIRTDLTLATLWLVAGLVALAQISPVISAQALAESAQRLIWGQPLQPGPLARSLGLQPPPGQSGVFDQARLGGLPRRHLLGAGPELSQQVALLVQPDSQAVNRYHYWRSLTYDRYTGYGWVSGQTETTTYGAGEAIEPAFEVGQPAVVLTEQIQAAAQGNGLLYAAGALLAVDQPYQVAWRRPGDAFGATVAAASYQVTSLLPAAGEAELRQAGNRYPAWVRQRYLALPREAPVRVLALARDLTATQPTPYDRARAIESYLRTLPYDLNLPPPPNRDVVDYFLFDLRRGYCDYYASAMVVLARAAGIPARLVVGYAGGEFDPAQGRYRVSEADAHAWAEVYFPGYGWIEFEPTAARPRPERAVESASLPEMELVTPPALAPAGRIAWQPGWGWALLLALAGLALASVVWSAADSWALARTDPTTTAVRLYRRLQRYGSRLAVPAPPGATPYEFSEALISQIALLTSNLPTSNLPTSSLPASNLQPPTFQPSNPSTSLRTSLPTFQPLAPAAPEIERLTGLYVNAVYSAHPPSAGEQRQAIQTWRRLRWRLWLAWARLKVERFRWER